MDNIPKLKNLSIVDQIKERVGKTNFIDITKIAEGGIHMSLEDTIETQNQSLAEYEEQVKLLQSKLEKETDPKETETIITNIIITEGLAENCRSYLKQLTLNDK